MCNYCNNLEIPFKKIPVLDVDLDLGILGKSRMSLFIRNRRPCSFLKLSIDNYGIGGETVTNLATINYCPMCGEKITEEEL